MKVARQIKKSRFVRPRILVIGELNVDIVATGVQVFPRMGTEVLAKNCELTLGSASAIFAAGISRLGHDVTFVSQVGRDYFGDFCIDALRGLGIDTKHVTRTSGLRTGVTIAISGTRDRALLTFPGAIASFQYEPMNAGLVEKHQHLHMTSYFLQSALRPSFPKIFRQARSLGLTTSLDPNSDPKDSWTQSLKRMLGYTNVLFVNKREALKFTRAPSVDKALKTLGRSVECAVIKLGSKGATARVGSELVTEKGFHIEPLDTTGAGDSFDAGFVSAYVRGKPLLECLREANACGALSALKPGGTAGQPNERQLRELLRHGQINSRGKFSQDAS